MSSLLLSFRLQYNPSVLAVVADATIDTSVQPQAQRMLPFAAVPPPCCGANR